MLAPEELAELWDDHASALLLIARGRCGAVAAGAAEDCVQEAFVRLAQQEERPRNIVAWLATTVRNASVDAVRNQQRRIRREQSVAAEQAQWFTPSTTDPLSPGDVQQALQQLDDETRDIVVAHLWNNLTFREIAAAFDLSPATTHRKYEAGIARLRSELHVDILNEQHSS